MNAPFQSQMDYKPKQSYFPVMIAIAIVAVFGSLGYAAVTGSFSSGDSGKNTVATKSAATAPELPTVATNNAAPDDHGATASNVPPTETPSAAPASEPSAGSIASTSGPHTPALANAAPAEASNTKSPMTQANAQGSKKRDKDAEAPMKTPGAIASTKPVPKLAQPETAAKGSGNGAANVASLCSECGVVESVRRVDSVQKDGSESASESADASGNGDANASSYRIQVHMEDGKVRIVYQRDTPTVAIGDHVKIVDGAVVQQS